MWSGEKLKPPTKDTHGLRLNRKASENRQQYPPDEDLDAIHVISSEYEIVSPNTSCTQPKAPPPPPPPPPPNFLPPPPKLLPPLRTKPAAATALPVQGTKINYSHLYPANPIPAAAPAPPPPLPVSNNNNNITAKQETSKPVPNKIKYGALSKSYLKKLSAIFAQHPTSNSIFPKQTVQMKSVAPTKVIVDDDDEGHCSFSDKSSTKNEEISRDMKMKKKNGEGELNASTSKKKEEDADDDDVEKRELENRRVGTTFTLPRIALMKGVEPDSLDPPKTIKNGRRRRSSSSTASGAASTVIVGGRISSHYSTEKSGSSGYYGSNLYSAGGSVAEEHIYSEPMIVEHAQVHSRNDGQSTLKRPTKTETKEKERVCLDKLSRSITKLEKSLPDDKSPPKIMPRRRISLPRDDIIPKPVWPGEADDSLSNMDLKQFESDLIKFSPSPHKSFEGSYMDMIDYHQTREILCNIQDKLETLLDQHRLTLDKGSTSDLETNIMRLKDDLENYLHVMNEKSENDLRQFSAGMTQDTKVQTVKKALDHKSRICRFGDDCYEVMTEPSRRTSHASLRGSQSTLHRTPSIEKGDFILTCNENINPFNSAPTVPPPPPAQQQVPPDTNNNNNNNSNSSGGESCDSNNIKCPRHGNLSQMQRNIALSQLLSDTYSNQYGGDRERMLNEWHRDKPSIWEMYYGTNRYSHSKIEHAMIREYRYGKQCAMNVSYPSTRPESDFTLDLPRAEELRVKMEKEKQFRKRCRLITCLLSILFFLFTVMIVSLVLTRGKRMFGSMI